MLKILRTTCAALLFGAALDATAGCGTAFCSLNTDWSSHGAQAEPGGRFDLRYEFIDQDQLRAGTRKVGVGEIPSHHDEVRTINRNLIAAFDYTFNARWGIAASLPAVSRDHEHIHNHQGEAFHDSWSFARLSDARITGRYSFDRDSSSPGTGNFGIQFGIKLPTGQYELANAEGDIAERTLQPGTGTTDAIAGVFYSNSSAGGTGWFADAALLAPVAERAGYKPGTRLGVDVGASYPWKNRLSLLLQVNAQWKDRDSGLNAEPEDTGGTYLHLSPGVDVSLGNKTRLYGFVQIPIYQYVNGVQLAADWSIAAGLSRRF